MDRFIECWNSFDEPGAGNAALHDFHEILAIACARFCAAGKARSTWAFREVEGAVPARVSQAWNGVPGHDTFSRLFPMLDTEQFRAAFQRFMAGFSERCEGVVAIDGKVLRRSFDRASGKSPLHMVAAWGCSNALCWRRSPPTRSGTKLPPCRNCWRCCG